MTGITRFVDKDDPAIEVLREGNLPGDAGCVMLWVQRATANPAADLAVEIASDLKLPVVAVFCLVPAYPRATLRHYHFIGLVRPMGMAAMKRTFDVDAYIRGIRERWGTPAPVVEQQRLTI